MSEVKGLGGACQELVTEMSPCYPLLCPQAPRAGCQGVDMLYVWPATGDNGIVLAAAPGLRWVCDVNRETGCLVPTQMTRWVAETLYVPVPTPMPSTHPTLLFF